MRSVTQSTPAAAERTALSRREDGKARVRAGLLAAARRLFARQGVAETTMDDIARVAGVSRPTVFNYFPSKNLLLAALVHEMESRFLQLIDRQFDQPATAAQRIAALFSWTAAKVEETAELSRVLVGASETTFGAAPDSAVRTERTHLAFKRLLDQGRRDGNVRSDVPTEVLAEIVGGTYAGILHAWRVAARYPLRRRLDAAAGALEEFISATPRTGGREGAR